MEGYGDDNGFEAWADANGYVLPETAPSVAVLRLRGSDYIDATYGARFKGVPTEGSEQDRAWPRTGSTVYGSALATNLIPNAVVNASYLAAWIEASSPGSLSGGASNGTGVVRRQKAGDIEREFFEAKQADGQLYDPLAPTGATKIIPDIDNALRPYLDLDGTVQGFGILSIGSGGC